MISSTCSFPSFQVVKLSPLPAQILFPDSKEIRYFQYSKEIRIFYKLLQIDPLVEIRPLKNDVIHKEMHPFYGHPSQTTPPCPVEKSYQGNSAQPSHVPSLPQFPAQPLWQGTDCLPGISSPTPTHMAKQARVGSKTTVHHMASANFRWIPLGFLF